MTANKSRLFRQFFFFLRLNGTTGGALILPFFGRGTNTTWGQKIISVEKGNLPLDTTAVILAIRAQKLFRLGAGVTVSGSWVALVPEPTLLIKQNPW